MDGRRELWRGIQLHVRSIGLVMKKIPVTLINKVEKFTAPGGQQLFPAGHEHRQAIQQFRHLELDDQAKTDLKTWARHGIPAGQQQALVNYVEDVLTNRAWSKSLNLWVAYSVDRQPGHGGNLSLAGVVATGTFVPDRDDGAAYTLRPNGISQNTIDQKKVAEFELVVSRPHAGFGKAIALWGIGDLLMRSSMGVPRYTDILAFATSVKSRALLQKLDFVPITVTEDYGPGLAPAQSGDHPRRLRLTNQNIDSLLAEILQDRQDLYELCPIGQYSPKLWGRCR